MNAKQELIRALEDRGLEAMAEKARVGDYSDLSSSYVFPTSQLIAELEALGHHDLAQRARNGDFDHER
jgi:hypothetical protein